jgi:hypothetical protein
MGSSSSRDNEDKELTVECMNFKAAEAQRASSQPAYSSGGEVRRYAI